MNYPREESPIHKSYAAVSDDDYRDEEVTVPVALIGRLVDAWEVLCMDWTYSGLVDVSNAIREIAEQ